MLPTTSENIFKLIKEQTDISVCVSLGLLDEKQFEKLNRAGIERIHNNLETSENYFQNVCTTHTYAEINKSVEICTAAIFDILGN